MYMLHILSYSFADVKHNNTSCENQSTAMASELLKNSTTDYTYNFVDLQYCNGGDLADYLQGKMCELLLIAC